MTPVLAVGAAGLRLEWPAAFAVAVAVAAITAELASRPLDRTLGASVAASRGVAIALGAATAVAIVRIATISVFMADASRTDFCVTPGDEFRTRHSCMSAYAESARFLHEGSHNIYDRELYILNGVPRELGPLRVDPFHYPPPFLLLPQAVRLIAPDFWDFRRVWFAMQALTLGAAVVGLAAWIGRGAGAYALLGGVLLLTLPQTLFTFQQGNFQMTAVALAVTALVLLVSGSPIVGGASLAYAALGKIFPGVLAVPLLAGRQWRAVAWLASMGMALLVLTVVTQGTQPMRAFASTALPEISDASAFPQTESPQQSQVNWSVYGQTVRLRQLGISWLTKPRGLMLMQVYGLAVIAFAIWAGWRRRFELARTEDRIALVLVALGLLGLAQFRSPFVAATYGSVTMLWTLAILAARASTGRDATVCFLALSGLAAAVWTVPSPGATPSVAWVWISGALVTICMAISVWAVIAGVRSTAVEPVAGRDMAPLLESR